MKKCCCLLLAVLLAFSAVGCRRSEKNDKPNTSDILTPPGTYTPSMSEFYEVREKLYDYFLNLLGYGHISQQDENGKFNEGELIQFALIQLSFNGINPDDGLTKSQIDRTTHRYFNQKIEDLSKSSYLQYIKSEDLYYPKNDSFKIGQFMILKSLTVSEEGVCTAQFDRIPIESNFFENNAEDEVKTSLLNGDYNGFSTVQHVTMTYRERSTAAFGYYIQVMTLTLDK